MKNEDKEKLLDILSDKVDKCDSCGGYNVEIERESEFPGKMGMTMRKCKCDCGAEWWDFKEKHL